MKFTAVVMITSVLLAGCVGKQDQLPLPAPIDPLPASSAAEAERDAAWDGLQELLEENDGVLPRLDVKDMLVELGATAYTQQFSAHVGSWPEDGAIYVYGWKAEEEIHAIVARVEGDNIDINDAAATLLEKRDFPVDP